MSLAYYFNNTRGIGILSTADASGRVDAAVYARPHVINEETLAFIMADRLSHRNLQSNPHAAYLFIEVGEGYKGKRLHITKLTEETDPEKIRALRRRPLKVPCESEDDKRYLVHFRIDRIRPLIGEDDQEVGG